MGTEAQQALKRGGTSTRAGSAGQRNVDGTRRAQALARKKSGTSYGSVPTSHRAHKDRLRETSALTERRRAKGVGAGYGGMGYGPTAGDSKALQKTNERADPGRLARDTINAMSSPMTVRATGSIWDDPNYAAMANEHGAEFAMRARNLDQKINAAKAYQQGRMESMQNQFQMEKMKRDNSRDQMAYQQEAATYGSPDQVSEAYGGGAYRDAQGNIVRPGAQQTDPRTGLAVDEEGAFTGREPGPDQVVGKAAMTPGESEVSQQAHELDVERMRGLSESLSTAIENRDKDMINRILKQMQGSDQSEQKGPQSAEEILDRFKKANPDATDEEIIASDAYKNAVNKYLNQ